MSVQPLEWRGDRLVILDQTKLPLEETYLDLTDYRDAAEAIRSLRVRGAPAIGIAGAYAVVLGARPFAGADTATFKKNVSGVIEVIAATRPTARNLFFALERMRKALDDGGRVNELEAEARAIHDAEVASTERLSDHGAALIEDGWTVLTHCNAGPLATSGAGTALGVIIRAHEQGKKVAVYADETRPLLQGARLTTWELRQAGVPVTLITDNMAGHFMKAGKLDAVITGADRIAANGDAANKIGTYTTAVLAKAHGLPFYIAAPSSTFDLSLATGDGIPIEERDAAEVTAFGGRRTAPEGVPAANPAFDVTPAGYLAAIITEKGVIRPPYPENIRATLG